MALLAAMLRCCGGDNGDSDGRCVGRRKEEMGLDAYLVHCD